MKRIFVRALAGLLLLSSIASAQAGEWKKSRVDKLDYWIYVPAAPKAAAKFSLMVNLHGCGQSADALKEHGNWESAADQHGMVVALPQVPDGGVVMGCWDYYGMDHTENNRHNKPLITLIETLLADPALKINRNRVYISGLSSGGGQSIVLACLRPDLIAGVGLSSSPAIGSGMYDLQSLKLTADDASKNCLKLAGSRKASLKTQVAAIIHSDQDYIVNPEHARVNRDMLRAIYGTVNETTLDPGHLPGTHIQGEATLYSDSKGARIAFIINNGLGHNWPSGQGGSNSMFVAGSSVNFPMFLGGFFEDHEIRK